MKKKFLFMPPFTILTMRHEYLGEYTLTRKEFEDRFSLSTKGIQNLFLGKVKNYNGWELPNATKTKN